MKKNYTKPYIVVETFQLDAAIADSCSSEGKQALNFDGYKTNIRDILGHDDELQLRYKAAMSEPNDHPMVKNIMCKIVDKEKEDKK